MANVYFRYGVVRIADKLDDQQSASAIVTAYASSITQEDLQVYFLSQMKRIIWGNHPGHWYLDFAGSTPPVFSLADLSAGAASYRAIGVPLIGSVNGVNRTFQTPHKFVNVSGGETIAVYKNGRRLVQGINDPRAAEYYVSESGGLGSGFDTVNFVSFTPSSRAVLVADYLPLP